MTQKEKLITILNSLLVDKLSAVNQFMAHSEMFENLGYNKLHEAIQKRAMDQMLHAEWLIERIKILDGANTLSKLNSVMVGKTVSEIMSNHDNPEAFSVHTDALELAQEVEDYTTAELLHKIMKLEKSSSDWAEIQREHLEQEGVEDYLVTQVENQAN